VRDIEGLLRKGCRWSSEEGVGGIEGFCLPNMREFDEDKVEDRSNEVLVVVLSLSIICNDK
jgi:hypothetical protein